MAWRKSFSRLGLGTRFDYNGREKDSDFKAFLNYQDPGWLTYSNTESWKTSLTGLNSEEAMKVSEIKWCKMYGQVSTAQEEP